MAMEVKVKVEDFSLLSGATVRGWNDYGGGDADRLFTMSIGSNKSIYFEHYTSADAHLYKGPSAAMPYVNGDTFWVRVELNAVIDDPGEEYYNGTDRHVVRSYYRTADTGAWTQLSAHLAAGTAPLRTISPTSLLTMLDIQPQRGLTVHKYRLYDSIDQSSPCLPILPVDHFDKGSANNVAELVGSPILTIHNASVSGYGVRNFIDPSQPDYVTFPNLFKDADTGVVLNMVSLGHNQWAGVQYANIGQFISGVDDIFEGMEDRFPLARRLYVGQNPKNHSETENGTANFRHANGVARLMLSAASGNHGAINVWQAFKEDGLDLSDLVVTAPGDYQHPTAAGSVLWSQTMLDAWDSHSF